MTNTSILTDIIYFLVNCDEFKDYKINPSISVVFNKQKTKEKEYRLTSGSKIPLLNYDLLDKVIFSISYNSHGMTGGNCYGDDAYGYVCEKPNNFDIYLFIDKIIDKLEIEVNYLEMKNIIKKCISTDRKCESQYYGNEDNYEIISFDILSFVQLIYYYI